ncbi:receptor-like protein 9b isoform X2 [Manihot esculenta]|uniref:receptor-like protein 9b isoform X2 n=1 Tax=Manihot esculenta TaxID=3983 RepID=UPI001CC4A277|nr:receptor-like protein 9b isoform X2 [Manihot esculenta]
MKVMKVCFMVLVMIMVLLLQEIWCSADCWETDRIALLQLQSHLNYSLQHDPNILFYYDYSTSFSEIDVIKCCDWERVRCSATTGRIIQLNLDSIRDFSAGMWYLNASLFLPFQHLNHLDLNYNQIAGCFKNEGGEELLNMSNLEFLDMRHNHLGNGVLSLKGLSSLKTLWIDYNQLKGSFDLKG